MTSTALLAINGMDCPIAMGAASFTPKNIGQSERGAGVGEMLDFRRGHKSDGAFTMTPQLAAEGDAWEGIITGRGVRWSYDESLVSDFGIPPASGGSGVLGTTSPAAKFGTARLAVASTLSQAYTFNILSPDSRWSVLVWMCQDGTNWHHYMLRSDAVKYKDGAVLATAFGTLTVSTSWSAGILSVTLTLLGKDEPGTGNHNAWFDELVFLPYLLTPTLLAAHYAAGVVWGACPRVNLSGLGLETGTMAAYGNLTERKYLGAQIDATGFQNNNRVIAFTLTQV